MSEQKWTTKKAQNLVKGDLIPSPSQRRAVEVHHIELDGDNVMVHCYHDLYKRVTPAIYQMTKDQRVPVAVSGVRLMDDITTYGISE
jgi:hypothetical protein